MVWLVWNAHAEDDPAGPKLVQAKYDSLDEAIAQIAAHLSGELVGVFPDPLELDGDQRKTQGENLIAE